MELDLEDPQPGIYYDVPEEDYFSIPAIHNSFISRFIDKSPKHAWYEFTHSSPPTKSQKVGSLSHKALLEPEIFHRDIIPYLPGDGRKGRVRNSKKLVKKLYPDAKEYIKFSQMEKYLKKADEAMGNEIGKSLQRNLATEVTMIVRDPETNLLLKCRWDAIHFEKEVGFDYKTTRNVNPRNFKWDIWKYGYYRQLAFYLHVASILGYDMKKFLILAQEKKPPYVAVWFDLFAGALTLGTEEIQDALKDIRTCFDNNDFPGYVNPTTERNIIQVDLPEKAYMYAENDEF